MSMFLARMVFFRLHESPRYLVGAGRHQEALESLQMISKFNGSDLSLALEDVADDRPAQPPTSPKQKQTQTQAETPEVTRTGSGSNYSSTQESRTSLSGHVYMTPAVEHSEPPPFAQGAVLTQIVLGPGDDTANPSPLQPSMPVAATVTPRTRTTTATPRPRSHRRSSSRRLSRRSSSVYEKRVCSSLPRWLRRPLWAWWDRVMMVLAPEWLRTTVLVWGVWFGMSLAYTMFNVFFPKLLETSAAAVDEPVKLRTIEETLWDVVIFTLGGCPGALIGAWMVESPLGRRWSLAGSTLLTAFFCVIFIQVHVSWAVRASSVGISVSATAMYAVLYGWTPDIFGTEVRGTACGIASALSRIGGMIAPILGGVLLVMSRSIPVYTSVVVYLLSTVGILLLKEGAGRPASYERS